MKRLLILAYDFPPYVSVGGLRPYAWYKYLKEFGVYPIVITRQWANEFGDERDYVAPSKSQITIIEDTEFGTIIRTPYKPNLANKILLKYGTSKFSLIRKTISAFYEFFQYLFFIGPKSGLYYGAKTYLKTNTIDAIIATGEPFVLFKYASKLSEKHSIPWIADYRDPWLQNSINDKNYLLKKWYGFLEREYANKALGITTVSEYFTKIISSNVSKPFHIIANGYNSDNFEKCKNIPQKSDKLRIAFIGTIYKYHPIESVLDCFNTLVEENKISNFEINFYGLKDQIGIEKVLSSKFPKLRSFVNIFPRMDNNILMQSIATHNIQLLFNYYSTIGTKIYDYLALQRLILFCYSDDKEALVLKDKYYGEDKELLTPQQDLIRKTDSGIIVKDKNELLEILPKLFEEFQQSGKIECHTHDFEQYSRKMQSEKLADLVKTISTISN